MVGHLAERMHHSVEPQASSTQNFQPEAPIVVVKKDVFAAVTPRGHVIKGTGKLKAKGACHAETLQLMLECWT